MPPKARAEPRPEKKAGMLRKNGRRIGRQGIVFCQRVARTAGKKKPSWVAGNPQPAEMGKPIRSRQSFRRHGTPFDFPGARKQVERLFSPEGQVNSKSGGPAMRKTRNHFAVGPAVLAPCFAGGANASESNTASRHTPTRISWQQVFRMIWG